MARHQRRTAAAGAWAGAALDGPNCERDDARFRQAEGAVPLTSAVARIPSEKGAGVRGGTGFNDAARIAPGVWKDRVLPSQTLWYKVPAGWGQQVRYDVEFANEPTVGRAGRVGRGARTYSYGATELFTPARFPVGAGGGEHRPSTPYDGHPAVAGTGSVPVAWTNRYESRPAVLPVQARGDFYLAVTPGARAAEIAENPRIGVVLRVAVLGDEPAGPERGAPVLDRDGEGKNRDKRGNAAVAGDSGGAGGAGWTGIAAAAGAGALVVAAGGFLLVRRRGRSRHG
ncbi:hypothetical protein [Streptomyces sp. NPDC002533]